MTTSDGQPRAYAVDVADATVTLAGRPVLRQVSLRVAPGELVALLGTNGSGKSTLVRACVGLLPLLGGSVRLHGVPLAQFRDWRRIGYVPQQQSVGSGVPATVREVVATGRLPWRRPFLPAGRADRRAVDAALHQVDLADRAEESVAELSGGQQQRVLIARALAGGHDLLVLDEPTAGVDLPTQELLARLLGEAVAAGTAVLLVAHELGPLERLVDRVVVLRDGRVAYAGPPGAAAEAGDHSHAHASHLPRDRVLPEEGIWR